MNYDGYSGPDPGDIEELFDPLYKLLTAVRVFGSDAPYNSAAAMAELTKWTGSGRKDDEVLNKAYDDYVELVRNDLGVSQPAGATELVRANG